MQSQHNREVGNRKVEYFGSCYVNNKTAQQLSNFYETTVTFQGVAYPSSEHAFQSHLVDNITFAERFKKGGDLATYEALKLFSKKPNLQYWKDRNAIGVVAKKAISKTFLKKSKVGRRFFSKEKCEELFLEILMAKFTQNEELKKALLATGDTYLVEVAQKYNVTCDEPPRWGGKVVQGVVHGHNQMGALLMHVRDQLKS